MPTTWTRPSDIKFPSVWHTFQAPDLDGSLCYYDIQDLPSERFDDAVSLMKECYLTDEPLAKVMNLMLEPGSIEDYIDLWRISMKQKMAVGCFKSGSSRLVGVNFLVVVSESDPKPDWHFHGAAFQNTIELYTWVLEQFSMYKEFGIDHYLIGYGLGVSRDYRCRGIATEFLKGRLPMMQAMAIPYTATLFSASGTQKAAEKAGYDVYYEVE